MASRRGVVLGVVALFALTATNVVAQTAAAREGLQKLQ